MDSKRIPLEEISIDLSFMNRGTEEEITSNASFLRIAKSIRSIKTLINPISVRPSPSEEDKYIIIAGSRRFLAYQLLYEETGSASFRTIPCIIRDVDEKTAHILAHHENSYRLDLSTIESYEFKISIIPSLFNKGVDQKADVNFSTGMLILEKYIRAMMSLLNKEDPDKIEKKMKTLRSVTGVDDPMKELNIFFTELGDSAQYFWKKRGIFEYDERVKKLYSERRASFNLAARLNKMVEVKLKGIEELLDETMDDENIGRLEIVRKLNELIDKNSPKRKKADPEIIKKKISEMRRINKIFKRNEGKYAEETIEEIDILIKKIKKLAESTESTESTEPQEK